MEIQRKLRWGILGTSFISDIIMSSIQESNNGEIYCLSGRTKEITDNVVNSNNNINHNNIGSVDLVVKK